MTRIVFVEERPVPGRVIEPQPYLRIGRDECDVTLADSEVSRWHAAVRQVDTEIEIEDLGSTNGTWVNERRIEGVTPLSLGDRVRVGKTEWVLTELDAGTRVANPRPT